MTNWNECPDVEQTPGRVSGAWVWQVRAVIEHKAKTLRTALAC